MNPNSSKIVHFPIKNYYNLHFASTPKNQFFPTIPHTYFSSKFRTTFILIEIFPDDKPDTCSTVIQNSKDHINHIASLPKGYIGYIEVPITNEQPKYYQVNDLNTLVHNVAHTHFSLRQICMSSPTLHDTPYSNIDNVQPTSDTPKSRTFPTYSSDSLKFINKIN